MIFNEISDALKTLFEALQNFDEEQAANIISNTFGERVFSNSFNYGTIHLNNSEITLISRKVSTI